MTNPPLARLRRLHRHPQYALTIAGFALGYLVGSIQSAVLGAVMGFFVGKTIQSLARTRTSE